MSQEISNSKALKSSVDQFIDNYIFFSKKETYTSHPLADFALIPGYMPLPILGAPSMLIGLIEDTVLDNILSSSKEYTATIFNSLINNYFRPLAATATSYFLASKLTPLITNNNYINNGAKILPLFFALETALSNSLYKEIDTENQKFNAFSVTSFLTEITLKTSAFVITTPFTLLARIINKFLQVLDETGIIEASDRVPPFKAIDAALFSAGGDNSSNNFDRYPLHNACSLNQIDRVSVLLENLTIKNLIKALTESDIYHGGTSTAFTLAALHGHQEVVEELAGLYEALMIPVNLADADGKTPLMVAAAKGHWEVFNFLAPLYKQSNFDMAEQDKAGNTAIHYIATTSLYSNLSAEQLNIYHQIIQILLANGVDINALSKVGQTALDILVSKNVSNVSAFKIAENIELSHMVGHLLADDPDIHTILARMHEASSNIENKPASDVEGIYKLLVDNGATANLEIEHQIPSIPLDL